MAITIEKQKQENAIKSLSFKGLTNNIFIEPSNLLSKGKAPYRGQGSDSYSWNVTSFSLSQVNKSAKCAYVPLILIQ